MGYLHFAPRIWFSLGQLDITAVKLPVEGKGLGIQRFSARCDARATQEEDKQQVLGEVFFMAALLALVISQTVHN
ncbi:MULTISPECIES: hypothetical protein [unclassified Microbulbifer]|uniref:hypothetical protein n=1 Tax=unclassified Microbulbifer TaxID=2619833 RepID=UPI0027E480C3|nr:MULTISPECIES: hypothetical protein [unclassified Microbulbifer]